MTKIPALCSVRKGNPRRLGGGLVNSEFPEGHWICLSWRRSKTRGKFSAEALEGFSFSSLPLRTLLSMSSKTKVRGKTLGGPPWPGGGSGLGEPEEPNLPGTRPEVLSCDVVF